MTDGQGNPTRRPDGEVDDFAIGADADGKVEVLSPAEYQRRRTLRDAEEADA